VARRRHTKPEAGVPTHDLSGGTPAVAISAAGGVALAVTAVIVTLAVI